MRNRRADRSPRHDDRPLRAKGPARTNRDDRRNRLERCDFGLDPAPVNQDRSMASGIPCPDSLGSIAGHQANYQRAANRHQHRKDSQVIP
jgi:hypothetical protein